MILGTMGKYQFSTSVQKKLASDTSPIGNNLLVLSRFYMDFFHFSDIHKFIRKYLRVGCWKWTNECNGNIALNKLSI